MSDMNVVVLNGNLGAAPEVQTSQSGVTYARFSMAVNRRWKDQQGGTREAVDWIRLVAFNGLAGSLTRLDKGDQVSVQGRLQSKTYKNRDGIKVTVVEVVAERVQFLRLKNRPADEGTVLTSGAEFGAEELSEEDDIPF
jgi:single-strand DNA-binding protein